MIALAQARTVAADELADYANHRTYIHAGLWDSLTDEQQAELKAAWLERGLVPFRRWNEARDMEGLFLVDAEVVDGPVRIHGISRPYEFSFTDGRIPGQDYVCFVVHNCDTRKEAVRILKKCLRAIAEHGIEV